MNAIAAPTTIRFLSIPMASPSGVPVCYGRFIADSRKSSVKLRAKI
jgi:hypothetical protein